MRAASSVAGNAHSAVLLIPPTLPYRLSGTGLPPAVSNAGGYRTSRTWLVQTHCMVVTSGGNHIGIAAPVQLVAMTEKALPLVVQ
jgi:hypothetical protein